MRDSVRSASNHTCESPKVILLHNLSVSVSLPLRNPFRPVWQAVLLGRERGSSFSWWMFIVNSCPARSLIHQCLPSKRMDMGRTWVGRGINGERWSKGWKVKLQSRHQVVDAGDVGRVQPCLCRPQKGHAPNSGGYPGTFLLFIISYL